MASPPTINKGQNFGDLIVIKFHKVKNRHRYYICKCICGNITSVRANGLPNGHTKSCGCLQKKAVTKHGFSTNPTPEYITWVGILSRCSNNKQDSFERYGGRGIKVCDRWKKSFYCFSKDMGKKPSINHSIDRINNNGNYTPSNCKWSTLKEQGRNKSNNRILTINGKSKTIVEWSEISGINYQTIRSRVLRGYTHFQAVFNPLQP